MITLTKTRAFVFIFSFVLLAIAFSSQTANANFRDRQVNMFKKSSDDVRKMSSSLERVLDIYIGADDDIYWNEPGIAKAYGRYVEGLISFNQRLEEIVKISKATARNQNAAFKRARGSKQCPQASQKKAQSFASVKRLEQNYKRALRQQRRVSQQTVGLSQWILNEGKITDGHIDDAVYDFGTKDELYAPGTGSVPFVDPEYIIPLSEFVFDYGAATDPIYMSPFYVQMASAIKLARQC